MGDRTRNAGEGNPWKRLDSRIGPPAAGGLPAKPGCAPRLNQGTPEAGWRGDATGDRTRAAGEGNPWSVHLGRNLATVPLVETA
jgi:hypothetical protein